MSKSLIPFRGNMELALAAGPILGSDLSGSFEASFFGHWAKNPMDQSDMRPQRAYFILKGLGRKMLNLSLLYKLALGSADLKKVLLNKNKSTVSWVADPGIKFIVHIKAGNLESISLAGEGNADDDDDDDDDW